MARIAIVGAGLMGTALTWPLTDNGHSVSLVGTPLDEAIVASIRSDRVHPTLQRRVPTAVEAHPIADLGTALEGAEVVVNGVSSFGVDWFAEAVGPYLRADVPVLSVTKGLEAADDGTLTTFPVALARKTVAGDRLSFNAIGGPCTAHELAARRQTGVVFTGTDVEVLRRLRSLFAGPYYHVWTSTDVTGVEVCAAMKNAYALGVGLAVGQMEELGPDGLALAYNPQAALFAQGCYEMRCLVEALGGDPREVSWLPGAGDQYVTIYGGRTVRLGKLLGKGTPFVEARAMLAGVTLESVEITNRLAHALPKLAARGVISLADFPLLRHLDQIINAAHAVQIPYDEFFGGSAAAN